MNSCNLLNEAVIIRTMMGRINSWSDRAADLYGWRQEDAIGKISHELLQTQFPKPLEEIESEIVRKGYWEGSLIHTARDGDRIVVQSRWELFVEGQSSAVIEVNALTQDSDETLNPSTGINGILRKVVNVVLASGAALCIFALLFFLYQYGWTEQRQFSSSMSAILHYSLPAAAAGLLIYSLRLKLAFKANIAIFCLSLAAAVYAMELCLTLFGSSWAEPAKPVMTRLAVSNDKKRDAAELTKKFGAVIDTRTAGEVIADLRKEGVDAVPIVTPSNNLFVKQSDGSIESALMIEGREVMPLAGVADKVTVLCNEDGRWIDYRSDGRGFNNPDKIWRSKRIEIAALGDSFVHGYCVPVDKNFVALIRNRYPATLNLGIAGDGPLLMLAKISEYLERIKPPIVLWFYYEGNDLTDLQTERKSVLLMKYLKDGFTQSELAQQTAVDRAIIADMPRWRARPANAIRRQTNQGKVIDRLMAFAKLSALRQRSGLTGGLYAADVEKGADLAGANMDVFRQILSQAKMRVEAWGGQLYFIYLPEWARYSNHTSWGIVNRDHVVSTVRGLRIPFIDIDPAFQAHGDPLSLFPFRELGHYTETGHGIVADEVLKVVSSNLSE